MAIEITSSSILKPAASFQSSGKLIPLTIFDRAAFDGHVPSILAFQSPTPTNEEIKHGLSRVLSNFPHVAGRLTLDGKGTLCICLNDAGIRIIEAKVSSKLCEDMPLERTKHLEDLYPSIDDEGLEELMQVQLNRYACGGLVIGLASHHYVCDGLSMSNFFTAFSQAVRAPDMPLPTPFLDRGATVVPREVPMTSFDHGNIEFGKRAFNSKYDFNSFNNNAQNLKLQFSANFISKLKASVPTGCSKFECLLAHVWKKVTAARGVNENEFTQIRVAVNCRGRGKPAVPMNFFGNMVLWAFPKLRVIDLLTSSYEHVVMAIRKAVAQVDDAYIKSFIDFGAIASQKDEELIATFAAPGAVLSPDLEVDSWLGFSYHDFDLGYGRPCAFFTPNIPIEGLMVFASSCMEDGGVDLFLALSNDHAAVLKQICYSVC